MVVDGQSYVKYHNPASRAASKHPTASTPLKEKRLAAADN